MATKDHDEDPKPTPPPRARTVDLAASERKLGDVVATLRDSAVDYLPTMSTILEEAQAGRAKEKLRAASLTPLPLTPGAPPRVSAPSPWAKGAPAAGAIDKGALPSALAPDASPAPVAEAAPVKAPPTHSPLPVRRPSMAVIGAVIAVFAPLILMYVLLVRPGDHQREHADAGEAIAASAQPATAAPVASAAPSVPPSAEPIAPPTPSAEPLAPAAPSAAADGGPASPAAPTPAGTQRRPRPHASPDDPYKDAAPPPPKSAEPAPPPPPSSPPPPPKPEIVN